MLLSAERTPPQSFDPVHHHSRRPRNLLTVLVVVRPHDIMEDLIDEQPELRFRFIQEDAQLVEELDVQRQ